MHQQPAAPPFRRAGPVAAIGCFLPVHKDLAVTGVGIHKQGCIGELFVRRDGGAEPDDFGALRWSGFGPEPVSSAGAWIGACELIARRITFVEEPRTIE